MPKLIIMNSYYTTIGPVRGECGHRHKSYRNAASCVRRDNAAVKLGYGEQAYSDRRVYRLGEDGIPVPEIREGLNGSDQP